MKYCPDCGCENLDEAQFCRNCGMNLEEIKKEVQVSQKTEDIVKSTPPVGEDSILAKIFFKTDKYTGQLRLAKSKTFSIVVFILMFLLAITQYSVGGLTFLDFIIAIIFALIFAVPAYVVGFILGLVADKIQN